LLQRLAAPLEPRVHPLRRPSAQGNHRAPPVLGVLVPLDDEQLVERLHRYQEHLDGEQKKVKELLERLVDAPQPEPSV
jgi:hypothetical protein